MTTAQFISKNFGVASAKDRSCSSVWADHNGNIYSYGYHYPLLFEIGGLIFRNRTGYSNTTARHIHWASGFGAIDVWLSGCNMYSWSNAENHDKVPALLRHAWPDMPAATLTALKQAIMADLSAELDNINERIASKKRTNTQVYQMLITERDDCIGRIATVKKAWRIK